MVHVCSSRHVNTCFVAHLVWWRVYMKSDMEKQNVSNDSILDYWKTFFPESKDNFEKI